MPIEDSKKGETSSNIPDAPSAPSAPGQASSEGVSSPQAPQTASVPEPASSEGTSSTQIPGIPSAPAQGSSEGAPSSMADSGEPTLPTLSMSSTLYPILFMINSLTGRKQPQGQPCGIKSGSMPNLSPVRFSICFIFFPYHHETLTYCFSRGYR